MKTPNRDKVWQYPKRYIVTNQPYVVNWTKLLGTNEFITDCVVEVIRGDTIADRVITTNNVTTFWLSGGTRKTGNQQVKLTFTNNTGETDAMIVNINVPA